MAEEKLLTVRDTSLILGLSEKEVMDLAEGGRIPAYKLGGVYLRFKRQDIEEFRKSTKSPISKTVASEKSAPSTRDKISDFFYFNDFYILSVLIIALILFIIFKGY